MSGFKIGILAPVQEPFRYIHLVLSSMNYEVEFFQNIEELSSQLGYKLFDAVIIDLGVSSKQNTEMVFSLRRANGHAPILGICLSESESNLKLGVTLLEKRAVVERFPAIWEGISHRLEGNRDLEELLQKMIGDSFALQNLRERIRQIAPLQSPVLVHGESGTGKELVARALSVYREPFIPVNCSAIPEHLFESELFGHHKGAFTGAMNNRKGLLLEANGGTLFLDEVAELPLAVQAKLLRALQESEIRPIGADRPIQVKVRVVCATHRDLLNEVEAGRFREDLYYRISVVPLKIPPLRQRREDIVLLTKHFIKKYSGRIGGHLGLSLNSKNWLQYHDFPGNVRELENHIQRALSFHDGMDGNLELIDSFESLDREWDHWNWDKFEEHLKNTEKEFLINQIIRWQFSVSNCAKFLGIQRTALQNRMSRLGISARELKIQYKEEKLKSK